MLAVLGGVDALVFTAGVGENSPEVRAAVCDNFAFLGLRLDQRKNAQSPVDEDISALDATVRVLVIHAQEELDDCSGVLESRANGYNTHGPLTWINHQLTG
jgi:acetate kinase